MRTDDGAQDQYAVLRAPLPQARQRQVAPGGQMLCIPGSRPAAGGLGPFWFANRQVSHAQVVVRLRRCWFQLHRLNEIGQCALRLAKLEQTSSKASDDPGMLGLEQAGARERLERLRPLRAARRGVSVNEQIVEGGG